LSRADAIVNRVERAPYPVPDQHAHGIIGRAALARTARHAMPNRMNDDRLTIAIGRLEQAIGALERRVPTAPAIIGDEPDESLRQRHAALRARTAAAVERLSQLLDTAGNS
jgi:hypothetical protein